jgi:hypothetical protein
MQSTNDAPAVSNQLREEANLIPRFQRDVETAGLVGEKQNATVVLLTAVSARLHQPLSVTVQGPSAAGKNHLLSKVAAFLPEEMKKFLTGMSPKALMHSGVDEFRHKAVFIAEYEGVSGADFAIRTMQSERVIEWEFVQSSSKGLQKQKNKVNGPASFIQATTRRLLHPENETRLLFLNMDESPEQTREILLRQAMEAANGRSYVPVDFYIEWHGLMRTYTRSRILIPFAPQLAPHFPADRVRSRRDFPKLLGLIEASAFIHQHRRGTNSDGSVCASAEDYKIAKDLFAYADASGPENVLAELMEAADFLGATGDFTVGQLMERIGWGQSKVYEVLRRALDRSCIAETDNRGQYRFLRRIPAAETSLPETVTES